MAAVLHALGFDDDPETTDTPALYVQFMQELDPRRPAPGFHLIRATSQDPVLVRELPFHSLCAHHLVPFFGHALIAYRPADHIAGLGSLARLLHHHARRPQLQERLGAQLADDLQARLHPRSLVVRLRARHLCMEMRGARTPGSAETLVWRGEDDPHLLALITSGEARPPAPDHEPRISPDP